MKVERLEEVNIQKITKWVNPDQIFADFFYPCIINYFRQNKQVKTYFESTKVIIELNVVCAFGTKVISN